MKAKFIGMVCMPWMRRLRMRLPVLLLLTGLTSQATAQALTLEEAWRQAEAANPVLRQAQANRTATEGELAQAREPFSNNPQVSTQVNRLQFSPLNGGTGYSVLEWNLGLSQTLELPDKQRARRLAAEQSLSATGQDIEEIRRQIRAEVEQRFIKALGLQQRIDIEEQALSAVEGATQATRKLVKGGEVPILQGNIAEVELERERNQISSLREQLILARADLATLLQLPADQLPQVEGQLLPRPPRYTLATLLASAARRPSQQALIDREHAAQSRLEFERASVYPDITVGINTGRGGEIDTATQVTGLSISVPLPLFNRNQARIGKASAEWTQAQIERNAGERNIPAAVIVLWQRLQSLRERVERLDLSVLPRLEQNRKLARLSYAAGQMDLLQFLLISRQATDAQRDVLDASVELRQTQAALEAAAGWIE